MSIFLRHKSFNYPLLSVCPCSVLGVKRYVWFSVSEDNADVFHEIERIRRQCRPGMTSDAICRLIRAGCKQQAISSVPRMDLFHKFRIRGKSVAEALYDGHITEQEIFEMFLSCKNFLEEMYTSPTLQRIIDRQKNGDITIKGGFDWVQKF